MTVLMKPLINVTCFATQGREEYIKEFRTENVAQDLRTLHNFSNVYPCVTRRTDTSSKDFPETKTFNLLSQERTFTSHVLTFQNYL